MAEQRHRIKRQILELSIPGQQATPAFYADVRRLYDQEIAPLIERCCSELCRPDQIHRIDRLELDLGSLDPNHFEADLVAKIAAQLRQKLSDCLELEKPQTTEIPQPPKATQPTDTTQAAAKPAEQHQESSPVRSQVELLTFFAHRGALPWWADASNRTLLEDAVQTLQKNAPNVLKRLMQSLSRESPVLQRWVRHFDDVILAELCCLAQPSQTSDKILFAQTHKTVLTLLKATDLSPELTETKRRTLFWEEMLRVSYAVKASNAPLHLFWKDVLMRVAGRFQCSIKVLMDALWQGLSSSKAHADSDMIKLFESLILEQKSLEKSALKGQKQRDQNRVDPQLKSLESEARHVQPYSSDDDMTDTPSTAASQHEVIVQRLTVLKQAGGFFESLFAVLSVLLDRLPPRLFPLLLSTLRALNPAKIGIPSEDQKMKETLRSMLLSFLSQEGALERPIKTCLLALADHRSEQRSNENQSSPDFEVLDADERYVENAGLVILWPFLNHFFKHMNLLEKKGFKDRMSLHRAVLLLQYIATEDSDPAEYSLTLNRILCGMALETVFDPDTPISEEEALECLAFLEAVIAKVPILKSMSPEGFRGSFLLRKGVLSTRDGIWFLRVTRSDFDVVLDRFPWSMGWVKLPWMLRPLQVEW